MSGPAIAKSAPRAASAALLIALGACAPEPDLEPGPGQSPPPTADPEQEERLLLSVLENGDFQEEPSPARDARAGRIPWWRIEAGGPPRLEREHDLTWLHTPAGTTVTQRVLAYAPLADAIRIRGRVLGRGRLSVVDGSGRRAEFELQYPESIGRAFEIDGDELTRELGGPPEPSMRLELTGLDGGARWADVEVRAPMPLPSEEELREEIVELLQRLFAVWLERGLDSVGPRHTAFACHGFDAVTGERLMTINGQLVGPYEPMLRALQSYEHPRWREALERFLEDYLELGLHPQTGLPRMWDPVEDRPLDDLVVEIADDLRFLIDAARGGPEPLRDRCREAAVKLADTVLQTGVLPDRLVAAKYRPSDGKPISDTPPVRRLDIPCQLARLGGLTGDERYSNAAHDAVGELIFTHYWPGRWDSIDPGFDDDFGHYGGRAVEMLMAFPDDPIFRHVVESGFEIYAPLWRDAMRFGGNIAADQVRCWEALARFSLLSPEHAEEIRELLPLAARNHARGEQYASGAWGDVTIFDFGPRWLPVGDTSGAPANLLWGLGLLYREDLGLATDEMRALFTAVMRSSREAYGREYGWLQTRSEISGQNLARQELRCLPGLIAMLENL